MEAPVINIDQSGRHPGAGAMLVRGDEDAGGHQAEAAAV